ncbi:MAG: hypothetical protein J3K34DRAFT_15266 [Monoraphidium minutum]|nr:MAG: hypothetical protein J3K34DRAFT_15266 [Monoraphidium minutum]
MPSEQAGTMPDDEQLVVSDSDSDELPLAARFAGKAAAAEGTPEKAEKSSSSGASSSTSSDGGRAASADGSDDGASGRSPGGPARSSSSGDDGSSGSDDDDDSSEDASGSGDGDEGGAPAKKRRRTSGGSDDDGGGGKRQRRRRQSSFPRFRAKDRCGTCHTCLNPQMKKACITLREKWEQEQREQGAQAGSSDDGGGGGSGGSSGGGSAPPADDDGAYYDMLAPMINADGGVKASHAASLAASLPRFTTPGSRFLPLLVLERSREPELAAFMAAGGADALAPWIADARGPAADGHKEAVSLMSAILKAVARFPVDMAFLRSSAITKAVGGLRKHAAPDVARDAAAVVERLFKRAAGGGGKAAEQPAAKRPKVEDPKVVAATPSLPPTALPLPARSAGVPSCGCAGAGASACAWLLARPRVRRRRFTGRC